ncbi:MAG: hypothetical protein RIK87_24225 [Fuerstiella sp.]
MFRMLKALTWEYLALVLPSAVPAWICLVAGPWAAVAMLGEAIGSDPGVSNAFYSSYVGVMMIGVGAVAAVPIAQMASRARRLPVSSGVLSTFLLLAPALLVFLLNAATLQMYRLLFRIDWPILTTGIALSLVFMIGAAGIWWLRDCRLHRLALMAVTAAVSLGGIVSRYFPDGFQSPPQLWRQLSVSDGILISVAGLMAWKVAGTAYQRYREGVPLRGWLAWIVEFRLTEITSHSETPDAPAVQSPARALRALAWQQCRFMTLVVTSLWCLYLVTMVLIGFGSRTDSLEGILVMFPVLSGLAGLMLGLLMGQGLWQQKDGRLKTYSAVLPVSDAELGRLILQSWVRPLATCWGVLMLIVTAAVGTCLLLKGAQNPGSAGSIGVFQQLGWLAPVISAGVSALLIWIVAATVGATLLIGRQRLAAALLMIAPAVFVLIVWLGNFVGPMGAEIASVLLISLALAAGIGVSIVLLATAFRRQLLSPRQIVATVASGVLLFLTVWLLVSGGLYWKVVAASFALLAIVPVPAVPMAVAWNRHR